VSLRQLYYTSCETGLSGYAGYQFNAVTDGTSEETMRTVESLTSYEPPRSHAQASDALDLDQCPVNLCFAPGKSTILASVSYVGRDSSNRVGNYFAHALASSDLDADDPGLLPIELWRAPWWSRTSSEGTSLPALAGPLRTGPLSRDQVVRFLDAHPHRDQVTALLTAAGRARARDDRSVLVVAESTDEVALWFAAVSYLLPPPWVRGLSFSTYLSRPSRSRLHLLGTLPETDLDLGPDAAERFHLFDFPGERFAAPPVHPLARLCASIGLLALPALWGWADSLAGGREASFDDWYPVVAAAAALGRVALTANDLAAVAAWLCDRDDLDHGMRNAIAREVDGQPSVTPDIRRRLRDVSAKTGDDVLWGQVSYELLEPSLRARSDGAAAWTALHGSAVPPACAAAAARVGEQLSATAEEEFRLATDETDTLSLLDWSSQAGLTIGGDVLAESGRAMIAPLLTGGERLTAAQRDQVTRVTGRWPEVREGIVRYLTELEAHAPVATAAAMLGLTGQLLTERDIGERSRLRVFYLISAARRRDDDPVDILGRLAERGETASADELLLHLLWPAGNWTLAEAARVLAEVDAGVLGGAADWFEATVATRPALAESRAYAKLCQDLMASPLAGQLASPKRPALREVYNLRRACLAVRRLADLRPVIRACSGGDSAPAVMLGREWVAPLVATLPADKPVDIISALSQLSAPAVRRYLTLTGDRIKSPVDGTVMHAAALYLILVSPPASSAWAEPHRERINELLLYVARWWNQKRLEETARLIDEVRITTGRTFREEVGLVRAGRFALVVKAVRGIRGLLPSRGADAAVPGAAPPGPDGDAAAGGGAAAQGR
jgi:hypothetical protein